MLDRVEEGAGDSDYVQFSVTGAAGDGAYHCAKCGYGVTVQGALPRCPMCSGETWERQAWFPFTRSVRLQ